MERGERKKLMLKKTTTTTTQWKPIWCFQYRVIRGKGRKIREVLHGKLQLKIA